MHSKHIFLFFLLIPFLSGCKQEKTTLLNHEFSLFLLEKDNSQAFLLSNNLDSVTPKTIELPVSRSLSFNREFLVRDGFYYQLNFKNNYFRKFGLTEKGLIPLDSIYLENNYLENATWLNESDTLLISTIEGMHQDRGNIFVLDTKNFKLIAKKQLPIPPAKDAFNILNIGVVNMYENKLWVGYSYSKYLEMDDYTTADTMLFMTLDWPSLQVLHQEKDNRSTYPGGLNFVQSYSFTDEKGNFYFMACPGIALGNNEQKPTAIFRKTKDNNAIDAKYMINISKQIGNHAYGMWYLGQQEVLIRSERKDLYTTYATHHSTYQFEYYRINLKTGAFKKLDVPLDKGTRKENVWVKGENVYIGIDDAQDEHAVWIYNKQTEKVQKGITIPNKTSFILRLDNRLN